jgi:endogenous inhibitor of DNA gyrase (YacG/DUF329 family)
MIRGRCPICSKTYEIASVDALPSFPFCTERCRMIDLGRWIDSKYVIPGPAEDRMQQEEQDETSADDVE